MNSQAVGRTVTILMSNLSFTFDPSLSTDTTLVLYRPDDHMRVWVKGQEVRIGKTWEGALELMELGG